MTIADRVYQGRQSFARQAWGDAYARLSAADRDSLLELEDLERLSIAANLIGKSAESEDILARAHQEFLHQGNVPQAARCAFWLGFGLVARGEMARGSGWLTRARRVLDEAQVDCAERGYLLIPAALQVLDGGDAAAAYDIFSQAASFADRFHDADLKALSSIGRGQTTVMLGNMADGTALLDEVMVSATSGEVSPIVTGIVYCAVIEVCHDIFDLRRAQEWTEALTRWCDSQPDLVPFRGQCRVRRAEIMQLHGAWQDAAREAQRACEKLDDPQTRLAAGAAFYQQAELHRLRGEFAKAEDAYRQAVQWGRRPEPGIALLRLAEGKIEAAGATIRRAVDEAQGNLARAKLLAAYVEVMLAANEIEAASAAAEELSTIAEDLGAPVLRAWAGYATGSVLLARGDVHAALNALRPALAGWQEFGAPYEAARVRALIARCCRELGDGDAVEMELEAARKIFQQLNASPDLARIDAMSPKAPESLHSGLTDRETEVIRLVAAGKTNRAIATELFISEKTVARHISNIFTKLGLSSRSAATAYAYEHGLL